MEFNKKNTSITWLIFKPVTAFLLLNHITMANAGVYFNPRFLSDDVSGVADLSAFEKGLEAPPGIYHVDIYLNERFVISRNVTFKPSEDGSSLEPCLTRAQLSAMGVNTFSIPELAELDKDACVPMAMLDKEASSQLDVGKQRLNINIPQALMNNNARGYIAPELWDNGITAGLLNYAFTGSNSHASTGGDSQYAYLNLRSGLNMGAWRLRDNSTWSYSGNNSRGSESGNRWQHINTWLERDVVALKGHLTLGDSYTSNDIFDGVNFRGVQLASEDRMLPDSQQGFAPTIHGIARSTAVVSIKQNGFEIYKMTVPAGPFTIDDLYPSGNGGDLQITVTEASGEAHSFSMPYASVPVLQREGRVKYALTAGEYRSGNQLQDKPKFTQATAMWGLPAGITLYGGSQLSDNYQAFNLGFGKNLGAWGAASFDITQAKSTLSDDSSHSGQSLRFLYSKTFSDTDTNVQLVGYRYSTEGYYSLAETTWQRMQGYNSLTDDDGAQNNKPVFLDYHNLNYSKRGQLQLSLTQKLGEMSTVYVSGSQQSYWNTTKSDLQLQAGLSSSFKDITFAVNYNLAKNAWQTKNDQTLSLNVNIPFSHWLRSDSTSVFKKASSSYSLSDDMKGRTNAQAGIYGTLFDDNSLSYNLQSGYMSGGQSKNTGSFSTSLDYKGRYGNANIGYSNSDNYQQLYYGLSGGVLAHANGVTFGQPLNNTVVLVSAPGAKGVAIENQSGVRTDWRGYAIQPFASEYRENRIALNTNTLPDNVDLDDAVVSVVPTRGAVVRADFKAHVGLKALLTINMNGKPVPFGSTAALVDGDVSSLVGDAGQVYMTGLPPSGKLNVQWGEGPSRRCMASYTLSESSQSQGLSYAVLDCKSPQ